MQLKNGSIIEIKPTDYPLIRHYGILVNYLDDWWVLHNNEDKGVHREPLKSVLERGSLEKVIETNLTGKTTDYLLTRFKAYEGKTYDLVAYNCETFVNEFINQRRVSYQVIAYSTIIGIVAIIIVIYLTKKLSKLS